MPISTGTPIRVLIVDHHTLVRAGLRMIVESQPGMEVVGEAGVCTDALNLASQEQPDIILFEMNLNNTLRTDLVPRLLDASRNARLIVVTGICDLEAYCQAVQCGAMGVVFKDQPAELLMKAIEKVYAGEAWLDHSMTATVLTKMSRPRYADEMEPELGKIALLSPRERQVITLIGQGFRNKQIAASLSVSEITVRHHLSSIFSKLGVSDRLELMIYAYRHDLAQLPR